MTEIKHWHNDGLCYFSFNFLLVMEKLLHSTKDTTSKKIVPSMKAFMDDATVISESKSHMEKLLKHLQELFKWAVMKIIPSKSHSLSIIKGKCQKLNLLSIIT